MNKAITVTVTEGDVKKASRHFNNRAIRAETCPIAMALRRRMHRGGSDTYVGYSLAELKSKKNGRTYITKWSIDQVGTDLIYTYDRGGAVYTPQVVELTKEY